MTAAAVRTSVGVIDTRARSRLNHNQIKYNPAYYEDQLNLFWLEVKRLDIYEGNIDHSVNCKCCKHIPNPVLQINNNKNGKAARKAGVARID
jgi:hypothetical protein